MAVQFFGRAPCAEQVAQRRTAMLDRRPRPLDPDRRDRRAGIARIADRRPHRDPGRQMGRARNLVGRVQRHRHGRRRRAVVQAGDQHRARLLARRQHLHRDLAQYGQRAERSGHQLAQVVAGDVLHHPAAGFEGLAPAADADEAEEMVARRAGLDAPRPGQVGHQDAAERLLPGRTAEQRAEVRRLESELLAVFRQRRLDLGERRRRSGLQDQFLGLVEADAGDRRQVEHMVGPERFAPPPLGAAGDDLQRRHLRHRPADGVEDIVVGFGGKTLGHGRPSGILTDRTIGRYVAMPRFLLLFRGGGQVGVARRKTRTAGKAPVPARQGTPIDLAALGHFPLCRGGRIGPGRSGAP